MSDKRSKRFEKMRLIRKRDLREICEMSTREVRNRERVRTTSSQTPMVRVRLGLGFFFLHCEASKKPKGSSH